MVVGRDTYKTEKTSKLQVRGNCLELNRYSENLEYAKFEISVKQKSSSLR